MVKRIVKSIYLVLTPLQKRLLRKVPWAKFGFLFLGSKICIFNIRDGEERERKKKFCLDWQYRQWLIDLLCFFPSFREARETFSQNFAFKNKCTLRYQVSSLLEAKVRLLFSSFAAAWPWSQRWWSYWNFATKLKRFPVKKTSLELLLWKTKNERIWECHGFCLAASGKFCSVWNFSVAVLESSGFTVSSPSIAFQLFIGVRAQNSSVVE